jgi:hypothetical protein
MLVVPYKSVGNLSFTDSREKIRASINEKFETGVKEFGSYKDYYDYFKEKGLFVYYDENDEINAFEFFEVNPIFNDTNLLAIPYHNLIDMFKSIDSELAIEYNGFTSYKFGMGGNTSDDPENELAMPEAIIIFKKGYYDENDTIAA